MDERISIGDKLDLEKIETRLSVDPDAKPKVYVSQVLDEDDDGNCLAAMPIQEGKIIPLGVGQEFFATFYTRNGLFRCKVIITGRYKKGSLFLMKIEQKTVLQKVQRREYYRLECNRPIEYRVLGEDEKNMLDDKETLQDISELMPEWKKGIILDLSGGGIRFVSSFREVKDAYLQVRFPIGEGENVTMIYAYAIILRSEQNRNNTTLYEHRIMFRKLDKKIREKIIRFIFNVQRKDRSKAMGIS